MTKPLVYNALHTQEDNGKIRYATEIHVNKDKLGTSKGNVCHVLVESSKTVAFQVLCQVAKHYRHCLRLYSVMEDRSQMQLRTSVLIVQITQGLTPQTPNVYLLHVALTISTLVQKEFASIVNQDLKLPSINNIVYEPIPTRLHSNQHPNLRLIQLHNLQLRLHNAQEELSSMLVQVDAPTVPLIQSQMVLISIVDLHGVIKIKSSPPKVFVNSAHLVSNKIPNRETVNQCLLQVQHRQTHKQEQTGMGMHSLTLQLIKMDLMLTL